MDFRQLQYFIAVAEELHFGYAAQRLHMSQPPLSNAIRKFESELEVTLFDRSSRSVSLTPAGSFLLPRAKQIVREVDDLKTALSTFGQQEPISVRIGFVGTASYQIMPEVLRVASVERPHLSIEVHGEMVAPNVERSLIHGELDFAVVRLPSENPLIEAKVLRSDRFVLAMPRHHRLLTGGKSPTLKDLQGEDFVAYESSTAAARVLDADGIFRRIVPRRITKVQETSTFLALVTAGIGIGFIPEYAYPLNDSSLVYQQLPGLPSIDLALAWRKGLENPLHSYIDSLMQRVIAGSSDASSD
ncbi:LysR substrate-binding domain-containing protein [Corynebacterium breve]|uniref:LysR substrate-binding domain-containing protein n=1 Tax=Corynebacterium breve TaxID=3049799 RepID=A0ABY8VD71_9CORY|nr:LysR substrate-binding domain-containing protein [Corynebacterium breve]WIM67605.1 LysR substrate-binding domain-containing protein [Corynebacterium breve]